LLGNQTIKFNENPDVCDEKIKKCMGDIQNTVGQKKMLASKKISKQKNKRHLFSITIFF